MVTMDDPNDFSSFEGATTSRFPYGSRLSWPTMQPSPSAPSAAVATMMPKRSTSPLPLSLETQTYSHQPHPHPPPHHHPNQPFTDAAAMADNDWTHMAQQDPLDPTAFAQQTSYETYGGSFQTSPTDYQMVPQVTGTMEGPAAASSLDGNVTGGLQMDGSQYVHLPVNVDNLTNLNMDSLGQHIHTMNTLGGMDNLTGASIQPADAMSQLSTGWSDLGGINYQELAGLMSMQPQASQASHHSLPQQQGPPPTTQPNGFHHQHVNSNASDVAYHSDGSAEIDVRSLSSSDQSYSFVDAHSPAMQNAGAIIFNPQETLHPRTSSHSSCSEEGHSHSHSSSLEGEAPHSHVSSPSMHSSSDLMFHSDHEHYRDYYDQHSPPTATATMSTALVRSIDTRAMPMSSGAPSTMPSPQRSPTSPIARSSVGSSKGRKQPQTLTKTSSINKQQTHARRPSTTVKVTGDPEKKVGRRKGPLRPDQRKQASEIRKLGACIRCRFLKKTCDKGEPCSGCKPSHARLWLVPCTRIDIKDLGYFMKDWKADYERHVSLGFSISNIKGFSDQERTLFITHGYGHCLPVQAREVFVRNSDVFGVDWIEVKNGHRSEHEVLTARLSCGIEGISAALLNDYLDRHIASGWEYFVDEYFEGTQLVSELLKTIHRYWERERVPVLHKALKLVLAYTLTQAVCLVKLLGSDEDMDGRIGDDSYWKGQTVAPVLINFSVKTALAELWRELQKEVLDELSGLFSSIYSKDKLRAWPVIFMLASSILIVWELVQFDCRYRVPDAAAVDKFCSDMESTPVGVIVGLFSAISQKVPAFAEWETHKHHAHLGSNPNVCQAMEEVRSHVHKYDPYLRKRHEAKFDREDFDCLSNKFVSKLVIRAH